MNRAHMVERVERKDRHQEIFLELKVVLEKGAPKKLHFDRNSWEKRVFRQRIP